MTEQEDKIALAIGRDVIERMKDFARIEQSNSLGFSPEHASTTYGHVPIPGLDTGGWLILVQRPEK